MNKLKKSTRLSIIAELILIFLPLIVVLVASPNQQGPSDLTLVGYLSLMTFIAWFVMLVSFRKMPQAVEKGSRWQLRLSVIIAEYAILAGQVLYRSGTTDAPESLIMIAIGLIFVLMGNLLPKSEPNSVFGIRTKWSLANRQNWVVSNRIGGWIYVVCGLLLWLGAAFHWPIWIFLLLVLAASLGSIFVSWKNYKDQVAAGTWKEEQNSQALTKKMNKAGKGLAIAGTVAAVFLIVVIVIVGKQYSVKTESNQVRIDSLLTGNVSIPYDSIESVRLLDESTPGSRTLGYNAFGYDLGRYSNTEYGSYLRYTSPSFPVIEIRSDSSGIVVFNRSKPEETRELYEEIEDHLDE